MNEDLPEEWPVYLQDCTCDHDIDEHDTEACQFPGCECTGVRIDDE